MFESARMKLTMWYLLIIMAISIAFSVFIYIESTRELDRALRMEQYRFQHPEYRLQILQGMQVQIQPLPLPAPSDPDVLAEAQQRVIEALIGINTIILLISTLAGYFLAGRTLRPIQNMLEEQNRFITDASHELNTPLTSLRTGIEVNLRNSKLTLTKAKEVLTSNLEEVQSLQTLSDDLIKLTQYQKKNTNFHVEKVVLSEIIAKALVTVRGLAEGKQILFNQENTELSLYGDKKSLTELFIILFDNAIKYSPEKSSVTIIGRTFDGKIEIKVKDNGIGINKEDMGHIFNRFYRVDASRTKQHIAGYGLGLSIAKRIVVLHKGTISVASELAKGTEFTIQFPREKPKN